MKSVAVVTPTVGNDDLYEAVTSVYRQTYKNAHHIIVLDGEAHSSKFDEVNLEINMAYPFVDGEYRRTVLRLPWNTGKAFDKKFWGHRIFAASGMLVNEDIICFLDEDNYYALDHVETQVENIETNRLFWSHSLRNICDHNEGQVLFPDNCESLGNQPVWTSYIQGQQTHYHLDTSAYAFTRDFLVQMGHRWYGGYAQDRVFFNIVRNAVGPFGTNAFGSTKKHTLNYRLGSTADSASIEFFKQGNEFMRQKFNGEYPWLTA